MKDISPSKLSRDDCVFLAKLSEQAERYEEMMNYMRECALSGGTLSVEERNLLSVAYKNVIGTRRASWRVIQTISEKESNHGGQGVERSTHVQEYKAAIETELEKVCNEILSVLKDTLIKEIQQSNDPSSNEARVFYRKMKGDYHRYLAEFQTGSKKEISMREAEKAYETARAEANEHLAPTHPIRLGLALNFSVYHYEIGGKPDKACELAKLAFDDAIAELDQLSEESYKDSTLIMQLLRDNLTLWTQGAGEMDDGADIQMDDVEGDQP